MDERNFKFIDFENEKKIIFNNLSKYVDYKDKNLFYADLWLFLIFVKKIE